ncbi:unnamed protein product [Amoebophrya sp. A120]|nr:unnamed protein product [Amoebophrya sp. A120]|eukprot:GSA120T00008270001.1
MALSATKKAIFSLFVLLGSSSSMSGTSICILVSAKKSASPTTTGFQKKLSRTESGDSNQNSTQAPASPLQRSLSADPSPRNNTEGISVVSCDEIQNLVTDRHRRSVKVRFEIVEKNGRKLHDNPINVTFPDHRPMRALYDTAARLIKNSDVTSEQIELKRIATKNGQREYNLRWNSTNRSLALANFPTLFPTGEGAPAVHLQVKVNPDRVLVKEPSTTTHSTEIKNAKEKSNLVQHHANKENMQQDQIAHRMKVEEWMKKHAGGKFHVRGERPPVETPKDNLARILSMRGPDAPKQQCHPLLRPC